MIKSLGTHCPAEGRGWLHAHQPSRDTFFFFFPVLNSMGLSHEGALALQHFAHCSTNMDGQGARCRWSQPAPQTASHASGAHILPPLWYMSGWIIIAVTGPFGLLRKLSMTCPFCVYLSPTHLCGVDNKGQYSVWGFTETWIQILVLPLTREKLSTSLVSGLCSKVRNSDVCRENKLKEERLTKFLV